MPANRHRQPTLLLARWQCTALVVLAAGGVLALTAWNTRVAEFGMRQQAAAPAVITSRDYDPVRGSPLTLLVTGMLCVLVTIIEAVRHA
ncbi:hypothetical protein [Chloroflexus sp.]|uniref:hypothetical protein n=1 Tax=Chloroflexus sp. TaxID=1904827 RepID=UPI002ADDF129|nr:hypothetical protein [Chloroflexus sp.]